RVLALARRAHAARATRRRAPLGGADARVRSRPRRAARAVRGAHARRLRRYGGRLHGPRPRDHAARAVDRGAAAPPTGPNIAGRPGTARYTFRQLTTKPPQIRVASRA